MSLKSLFEAGKFTVGPKQRGLAQPGYYLHISELGGNLKVNKLSFVDIADLFRVYIILFLAKPLIKISQNFPSCTGGCLCEKLVE